MSTYDETFDFVVVGSGGGSMCAGLVMRKLGKSVLILEKTDRIGGTTARSGGVMWIPNNPFMKRDGVEDSHEKAITYLDTLIGDDPAAKGTSRERRRTYVTEAPRMIDFLLQQGIKLTRVKYWPDYHDELPGGSEQGRTVVAELFDANELGPWREKLRPGFMPLPVMLEEAFVVKTMKQSWRGKLMFLRVVLRILAGRITGKRLVNAGVALQGRMMQASLRNGADIRADSAVRELIVENGAVKGVVAVIDGKPRRIGARLGVLVNAGGFARNQRMRDRYQPGTSAQWTCAGPGDTGEMIEEMARHGAATAQMNEMVGNQIAIPPGAENADFTMGVQGVTAAPHVILVDQSGVRYMNEGGSYMAYCKAMLARNKTVPAVPSWAIFDEQFLSNYMFGGPIPGGKKPQSWYDSGFLNKADSIEALARKIDVAPATLKNTVERFNGFVRDGRDKDFGRGDRAYDRWLGDKYNKPTGTLGTIEQGPFYAVKVYPGDVGTYGGAVTDVHARVLRADGSPIPGLYATGVSTASVMGGFYPGAGSSVGPSFVWGFVAAKHAANAGNAL